MTNALYRMYAADDALLYIGRTISVPERFAAHRHTKEWWSLVARIEMEHHLTASDLAAAELKAIEDEKPQYNVMHASRLDDETRRKLRAAKRKWENARPAWHRAIYQALQEGAGVMELAEETGYQREHIRRIRVAGDKGEL